MIILRNKKYSNAQQQGPGLATKVGTGLLAAGGLFAAAKTGHLGTTLGKAANSATARLGKAVGSNALMKNGARGWAKQDVKQTVSSLAKEGGLELDKAKNQLFNSNTGYGREVINQQNKFLNRLNTPPAAK